MQNFRNIDALNDQSAFMYGLSYSELLTEFEQLARSLVPQWDATNLNDDLVKISHLFLQAIARSNKFVANTIQETNPQFLRDIRSIRSWLETFGIKTYTRQPAIAIVRLEYTISSDVIIEPYELELSTTSDKGIAVFFQNLETITLRASQTVQVATFVEGFSFKEKIIYQGQEVIPLSQRFVTDELFLRKSLYVKVNGVLWNRVEERTFNYGANVYAFESDLNEQGRIIFGDSIRGMKPEIGSEIEIFYRINFGTQGNVSAEFDEFGNPIKQFFIRNPQRFPFIRAAFLMSNTSGAADPPSVRDLKNFLFAGINYGGQLTNEDDVTRYLLTIPGIKQAKTQSLLFEVRSIVVIDYFSDSIKQAMQSNIRSRIPTLFTFILEKAGETDRFFKIRCFRTKNVSDQYIRSEATRLVRLFLRYDYRDPLTGRYTNPIGDFVYLSTLGSMLRSISGVYDYEIEVYNSDNQLIASSNSKQNTQSKYLNDIRAVTSQFSPVEVAVL